jgi:hypothetical protein
LSSCAGELVPARQSIRQRRRIRRHYQEHYGYFTLAQQKTLNTVLSSPSYNRSPQMFLRFFSRARPKVLAPGNPCAACPGCANPCSALRRAVAADAAVVSHCLLCQGCGTADLGTLEGGLPPHVSSTGHRCYGQRRVGGLSFWPAWEEDLIRQSAARGNSQWRRGLALYPRMDIAG